ncbi:MAG: hypothetical protein K0Q66_418 [Chitinophagaceae bacterium]|nr:hypothetical protein [Chitinophagaceae bacterium]
MAVSMIAVSCKDEKTPSPTQAATSATTPQKQPTKAEMEKAMMDYATPGKMHEWLAKSNGTWEGDITSYWEDPSKPTMSKGTAVYKTILNGLYQEGVHTGKMGEMPFEGRSLTAYDNAKKVWISTWVDNMGSGVMKLEGVYDEKTKSMTLKGFAVDPMSGKESGVREVITFIDDNNQKMEMYCEMGGKEQKMMEIVSKRKK